MSTLIEEVINNLLTQRGGVQLEYGLLMLFTKFKCYTTNAHSVPACGELLLSDCKLAIDSEVGDTIVRW